MNRQGLLKSLFLSLRPKTLTAALVPVAVGTSLVSFLDHQVQWEFSFWALLGAVFIQIGTNLFNDAIDYKKGADTEDRVGPARATQQGWLSARQVTNAAVVSFVLAVLCGIPLVLQGGWVIVSIGIVSLIMGYAYTGGPYPLAYRGLGDIFVILFFGLVAVGGTFYLHTLTFDPVVAVAGIQVGLFATVLIAINNLRDIYQDSLVHKKTLAVRFGKSFAIREIQLLLICGFLINIYWIVQGPWWIALMPFVSAPWAIDIIKGVQTYEPGPIFNQFLEKAALVHIVFGLQLSLGMFLA